MVKNNSEIKKYGLYRRTSSNFMAAIDVSGTWLKVWLLLYGITKMAAVSLSFESQGNDHNRPTGRKEMWDKTGT